MPIIKSQINIRSQSFQENAQAMQAQIDDLNEKLATAYKGGSESSRQKHLALSLIHI